MESDEPVLFSKFGLKGRKDRHLRNVLERLGNPHPRHCDTVGLAKIWLADQHSRWHSLPPDHRRWLVADLLDVLYRKAEGFDALFAILFLWPDQRDIELGIDYSAVAVDILRGGMEHSFQKGGQMQNILDFPLHNLWRIDMAAIRLCPCTQRPLYVAFYCGWPELVRLLLNCGASLPLDDVCCCYSRTRHPLDNVFLVFLTGNEVRRQWDLLSLQVLLVDTPASLRHCVRRMLRDLGERDDVVEEMPSLKHMARACIRQQMRASRSIGQPNVLAQCGLPKSLESYIYVEEVAIDV